MARYQGRGLHGEVVELLGARIVDATCAPGTVLFADSLKNELGVSNTVVREALKVLAAKGLVDARPKRGTVVTERSHWSLLDADVLRWQTNAKPDMTFLQDLYETRRIIEVEAARLAAQRRDDTDLVALSTAMASMASSRDDWELSTSADLDFHRALLAAAHNQLITCVESVIEAGLRVHDQAVLGRKRRFTSLPEHQVVLDAVVARDAEGAAAAAAALIDRSAADLKTLRNEMTAPAEASDAGRRLRRSTSSVRAARRLSVGERA